MDRRKSLVYCRHSHEEVPAQSLSLCFSNKQLLQGSALDRAAPNRAGNGSHLELSGVQGNALLRRRTPGWKRTVDHWPTTARGKSIYASLYSGLGIVRRSSSRLRTLGRLSCILIGTVLPCANHFANGLRILRGSSLRVTRALPSHRCDKLQSP